MKKSPSLELGVLGKLCQDEGRAKRRLYLDCSGTREMLADAFVSCQSVRRRTGQGAANTTQRGEEEEEQQHQQSNVKRTQQQRVGERQGLGG